MNRRKILLGGVSAAIIPPMPAMADNWTNLTAYNKLGIPVQYSRELAEDLMALHFRDAKTII